MMRITSTLIWLRELSEMKAEGFEDSLCTAPPPPPAPFPSSPNEKSKKAQGRLRFSAANRVWRPRVFSGMCGK